VPPPSILFLIPHPVVEHEEEREQPNHYGDARYRDEHDDPPLVEGRIISVFRRALGHMNYKNKNKNHDGDKNAE